MVYLTMYVCSTYLQRIRAFLAPFYVYELDYLCCVLYAMLLMCMYIYYAIVFKSNGVWLEEMSKKLIFLFHIHISGTSLFVLPVLYSLFLSIQHIQKRIRYFCSLSLSLHKSFSIKLVWGAKKNCPKNLIEIKDSLWV